MGILVAKGRKKRDIRELTKVWQKIVFAVDVIIFSQSGWHVRSGVYPSRFAVGLQVNPFIPFLQAEQM